MADFDYNNEFVNKEYTGKDAGEDPRMDKARKGLKKINGNSNFSDSLTKIISEHLT